jgi:hypothetical protein
MENIEIMRERKERGREREGKRKKSGREGTSCFSFLSMYPFLSFAIVIFMQHQMYIWSM